MLPAQARSLVQSRENQRRCFLPGQRRRCDAEEPQPCSGDRLLLELVVPDSIVACNDDPAVCAGFPQPVNIRRPLRKKLVMDTDLDTSGAERVGTFFRPSDLSMKNTRGSGGFRRLELAADRFLDVERVLAIVLGEISDRLARLKSVRDHRRRDC
jgi:hypothetical protein